MEHSITYIGLDVHKDTVAVAVAETGNRGEVREYGTIANTPAALRTMLAKFARELSGFVWTIAKQATPTGA